MTIDYNAGDIARQYQKAKEQPWRSRVETFSLMRRIGNLENKNVVDIACGEGYFTRLLRQAGAAQVVGFDVSERMIELARAKESSQSLGIEYFVEDARTIVPQKHFDLAASAWLLVYAHNRAELNDMCRGVACWLRPGGRFVTLLTNPDLYAFKPLPDYRKYGFEIRLADRVSEGAPIVWRIHLEQTSLDIENYYLPLSAYETAFLESGFQNFGVHRLELDRDPRQGNDRGYWSDLLEFPPAIVMEGTKV